MCEQTFFRCKHCGNLVRTIKNSGSSMLCCGEPMGELRPNTVEAATEKHIPAVSVNGRLVYAEVGSVPHPMTEEHHIDFIYLQTEKGSQMKCLKVGEKAHAMFAILEDKPLEVFAYCNLHGLWKVEIPCDDTTAEKDTADETVCSADFADGCI